MSDWPLLGTSGACPGPLFGNTKLNRLTRLCLGGSDCPLLGNTGSLLGVESALVVVELLNKLVVSCLKSIAERLLRRPIRGGGSETCLRNGFFPGGGRGGTVEVFLL